MMYTRCAYVAGCVTALLTCFSKATSIDLKRRATTFYPLGCYSLGAIGPNPMITDHQDLSPQRCESICSGFNYFAMQRGRCYCCNELSIYIQIAQTTKCNVPCNGDSTQSCGGGYGLENYVNLYATAKYSACGQVNSELRVRNPGFESGMGYWTASMSSSSVQWQVQARAEAHGGKRLARIVIKGGGQITLSQSIPTCPGVRYVLTYYHTLNGGSTGDCTSQPVFDGVSLTSDMPENDGWFAQSVFVIPTGEIALLQIKVVCAGRQSMVFLDDIKLRPATPTDAF